MGRLHFSDAGHNPLVPSALCVACEIYNITINDNDKAYKKTLMSKLDGIFDESDFHNAIDILLDWELICEDKEYIDGKEETTYRLSGNDAFLIKELYEEFSDW